MPPCSTLPRASDAQRCMHRSSRTPTCPAVSRNATSDSPSRPARSGSESGSGSCADVQTGSQNRRIIRPIDVAGPTWVKISFSWEVSKLSPFTDLTSLEGYFHGRLLLRKIRRLAAVSQRLGGGSHEAIGRSGHHPENVERCAARLVVRHRCRVPRRALRDAARGRTEVPA